MKDPDSYQVLKTYLSRKPPRSGLLPAAVCLLLMATASLLFWRDRAEFLIANRDKIFVDHELWRLFTGIFVHSDPAHLAGNSLLLIWLGFLLHSYFGFYVFPILSFILGILVHWITLYFYQPRVSLFGASGMIYAMAGFWLVVFFYIERRYSTGGRLLRCLGFILAVLTPTTFEPKTSYLAHTVGLVLGLFSGAFFVWKRGDYLRSFEILKPEEVASQYETTLS